MRKFLYLALALTLVLVSCGKKTEEEIAVELQGISLNKKSLSMDIGETARLMVVYNPEEAEKFAPAVTWESSVPGVATVKDGKVTAKQKGKTTITAYCGKFYADCEVVVETGGGSGGGGGGEDTQKFEVTPATIDDNGLGGTYTITVTSNHPWQAVCEKPWATVSPEKGDGDATVTVTVEANTEVDADAQTITFTAGLMKKTVTVNRAGYHKICPITLDVKEKELGPEGGSFDVKVTCEIDWNVSCDHERVHITKKSDGVSIEVDIDKTKLEYSEKVSEIPVVFSNQDVTDTLLIRQIMPYAYLQPSQFQTNHGLQYACQVKSNISWQIVFTYYEGSDNAKNYMVANPQFGTGDVPVTVTMNKVHSGSEWMSGDGYVMIKGTGKWQGLEVRVGNHFYRSDDF
ncbi:MAG: Ig-like domain-containing protein [Paludibacteraceae bacterium]|nr:Ig-like domain-containing protein [Paludibacteraceae bacterium]